ncbi:hypothetical protein EDD22DRAFT_956202 [Suillus occidentalis]|nr:hypothetical protein EDD22DRAFT_956202 [Suillus occidentalis]
MPVHKAYADAIASKHFGKKVFDMCWDVEPEPLVETPMASSSAEPQYGGHIIDMCWDFASDVGPMVNAPANATMVNALAEASSAEPQYGGQVFEMFWDIKSDAGPSANAMANPNNSFQGSYDLCWDESSSSKIGLVPAITVEAATPPAATTTFDVCWDDGPATSATEYQGGFDMCWGDAPLGGDISTPSAAGQFDMCWDHQVATAPAITVEAVTPPATTFDALFVGGFDMCWEDNPTTGSVNSAANHPEPSGSRDQRASQTPSSTSTEVSVMAKVESSEPLVRRAADRLARISAMMGENPTEAATGIIEDNQALLTKYQEACNQYMTATTDIANIQHMLQIFRQIDDPLAVLELGIKKAGN